MPCQIIWFYIVLYYNVQMKIDIYNILEEKYIQNQLVLN